MVALFKLVTERGPNLGRQVSPILVLGVEEPLPGAFGHLQWPLGLDWVFSGEAFRVRELPQARIGMVHGHRSPTSLLDGLDGGLGEARGVDLEGNAKVLVTTTENLDAILNAGDAGVEERLEGDGERGVEPARVDPVLQPVQVDFTVLLPVTTTALSYSSTGNGTDCGSRLWACSGTAVSGRPRIPEGACRPTVTFGHWLLGHRDGRAQQCRARVVWLSCGSLVQG